MKPSLPIYRVLVIRLSPQGALGQSVGLGLEHASLFYNHNNARIKPSLRSATLYHHFGKRPLSQPS